MWNVQESWTKFVYPFVLNISDEETFTRLANHIAKHPLPVFSESESVHAWSEFQYYDSDLDNMVPYVKRYMRLPQNQRRFVLSDKIVQLFSNMQTSRMSDQDPGFKISEVDLYLFFNGVSFLVMEFQPADNQLDRISLEWIENVNADLASLTRRTPIWQRVHEPHSPLSDEVPSWLEEISAEAILHSVANGHPVTLQSLIRHLFMSCIDSYRPNITWQPMIDTFLLAYGAVLLGKPEEDIDGHVHTSFLDFAAKHITVLRKTLSSSNSNHFVRHILNDPEHNYVPYHNVIHTQSIEGGFVMAFDNGTPHFQGHRSPAMRSFRTNYFYMMLLALHQRMSILGYAMSAADTALSSERAQRLRLLRGQIYDFTARCYFSQASVSEERDQLYRRWQNVFNVTQMYDELKEEIKEIDDYLMDLARLRELENKEFEIHQEAQRTQLFSWVSFIFLPVTVVLYMIQASPIIASWINFKGDLIGSILLIIIMATAVLLVARAIYQTYKRFKGS